MVDESIMIILVLISLVAYVSIRFPEETKEGEIDD